MSFLGDITGGLLGGGDSSSASVTSNVNVDISGLDKVGITEKVTLDPLEIRPLSITETVDLKPIEIKPLSMTEKVTLDPLEIKPLSITETVDLKPVSVAETIDLKPVAVDSCQTLRLAPLPETTVCNPYHHHVAMNLFGVEIMAMTFDGESEQAIHSPRRPQVSTRTDFPSRGHAPPPTVLGEGRGIRVRVLDDDDE